MKKRIKMAAIGMTAVLVASLTTGSVAATAAAAGITAAPSSSHPLTHNAAFTFTNVSTGQVMAVSDEIYSGTVRTLTTAMPVYKDIQLKALQNGDVQLSSVASGLCFTPETNGSVSTKPCGAANQTFTAITSYGKYMWLNRATNLVLAADAGKVVMRTRDNSTAQFWSAGAATQNRISVNARGVTADGPAFAANTTLRIPANISGSGDRVRFQLSNLYGTADLKIDAASIAIRSSGSTPASTPVAVTFNRSSSVTIPKGTEIYTDPIYFKVTAGQSALISLHLPEATGATSYHKYSYATTYIADAANSVMAAGSTGFNRTTNESYILKDVDAASGVTTKTLVTLGDSITDGANAGFDVNLRWPDKLAERLRANGAPAASIANTGIGGNRILTDVANSAGYAMVNRFTADVIQRQGTTGVFIFAGVNDISAGTTGPGATSAQIIAGLTNLVTQARNADLAVNISTISPANGVSTWNATKEQYRNEVNAWIRANSIGADYVMDFDAVLRDPNDTSRMLPAYDCGDHIHPNAAGFAAMANAIDLTKLRY